MKSKKQILKYTDSRFAETTPKYVRDRVFLELLVDIRDELVGLNKKLEKCIKH
jgi:hypothetical protein